MAKKERKEAGWRIVLLPLAAVLAWTTGTALLVAQAIFFGFDIVYQLATGKEGWDATNPVKRFQDWQGGVFDFVVYGEGSHKKADPRRLRRK